MKFFILFLPLVLLTAPLWAQQPLPTDNTEYYLVGGKRVESKPIEEVFPSLSPHAKAFVAEYERVKWRKDKEALDRIIHPLSKACETEDNKDFFDAMRNYYLSEDMPDGYDFSLVEVKREMREALKRRLQMPIAPTHVMYIEFMGTGWQRFLREETDPETKKLRFYELVKCPSERMLREWRVMMQEEQQQSGAAE